MCNEVLSTCSHNNTKALEVCRFTHLEVALTCMVAYYSILVFSKIVPIIL